MMHMQKLLSCFIQPCNLKQWSNKLSGTFFLQFSINTMKPSGSGSKLYILGSHSYPQFFQIHMSRSGFKPCNTKFIIMQSPKFIYIYVFQFLQAILKRVNMIIITKTVEFLLGSEIYSESSQIKRTYSHLDRLRHLT